jgi:hypothetical protein
MSAHKKIFFGLGIVFCLGLFLLSSSFYKVNHTHNISQDLNQVANGLIIASNKKSLAPIILPSNHTPFMKEAATDLMNYIQKISGAIPELIIGNPNPIPKNAIWVGYQPSVDKLFPNIKFNYQHPEEIINACNEHYIIISGRDKWNPSAMNIPDRFERRIVNGIQQEYGTCNAVYTFIQDQLNVRWLLPGKLGEDIIAQNTLTIKPFVYRYYPKIKDRSGIFYRISLNVGKQSNEEQKWGRLQRMQLSSMHIDITHSFKDWWEKYGKTNPGLFAMLSNGKREPQRAPSNVKICMSNPDVWETWLKEVEENLKINPNLTVFGAGSNDGWTQGHCTCSKCRAWDPPGFSWENPELADREVTFGNMLGRKLKQKYPGKPYFVSILAYGYARPAPKNAVPDENVIVVGVFNFLQRGEGFEESRSKHIKFYEDWGKVAKNTSWRPNIGNPAGQKFGMPDFDIKQAAQDLKLVSDIGALGLFFDFYWFHWATQAPIYYAYAQCGWNPGINIDSLMNDYYIRCYGPAADEMKNYWDWMQKGRNELIETVKTRHRFYRIPEVYTEAWFKNAKSFLDAASKKLSNADKKYKDRLHFTSCGFEFSKLLVETRRLNQEWEKNPTSQPLKDAIDAKWKQANQMKQDFPQFAINFTRVFRNPEDELTAGLHYKSPLTKKRKKTLDDIPGFE